MQKTKEEVVAKKRLNKGPNLSNEKMNASIGSSNTKTIVQVNSVVDKYSNNVVPMPALLMSSFKSLKYGDSL
jgi:hypothetical protein